MTATRATVAKGMGGLVLRQLSDDRLHYLSTNTKYTFTRSSTEGDRVQGVNSDATLVDLDVAGAQDTYTCDVTSKKNTRNFSELALNSQFVDKATYGVPWAEVGTVASGTVTLNGGTPVATTLYATYLDGAKLTSTGSTPSAGGQYKDNADGTVTFHASDNGKDIAFFYQTTISNIKVQGGADNLTVGYLNAMFYQVSGTSSVGGKKSVDILWLPKCSLSGEASLEYSQDVQDKQFTLTAVIPDTPASFKVPYMFFRGIEINNTNAG